MTIRPSKAKKKPVEIEVVQYAPGQYTKREWLEWCPEANIGARLSKDDETGEWIMDSDLDATDFSWFIIPTLEGDHSVEDHAWVAKGVKGEFYPIRQDIFDETYLVVEVEGVRSMVFHPDIIK
ncbi:hypothetical protein SEA_SCOOBYDOOBYDOO_233 [Mycobacterium phage ScoobyDoobyDoo]|nr:hypothetical protein SEA_SCOOBYDOOBYDOO_233 [Mycobacterium phage ScoobyDoobyDoo]